MASGNSDITLGSLIVPAEFTNYVLEESVVKNSLIQSGVIVNNPVVSNALAGAGVVTSLLTFRSLDQNGTAANTSSADLTVSATPEKISGHKQTFVKLARNKVWSAADLDAALLSVDPVSAIVSSVSRAIVQWRQASLLSQLSGIAGAMITAASANVLSISTETVGYTAANQINAASIGAALVGAWGDYGVRDQLNAGGYDVAIFMHPKTYAFLQSTDFVSFQRVSTQTFGFTTYMGYPVIVDDTMPVRNGTTSGHVYSTYFVRSGAINFGFAAPKVATEIFRTPLAGNGAGGEQIFQRDNFAFHVTGTNFLNATMAGDVPSDAELALSTNWSQTLLSKQVGLVVLQHNLVV
jgi:hypothetical protein